MEHRGIGLLYLLLLDHREKTPWSGGFQKGAQILPEGAGENAATGFTFLRGASVFCQILKQISGQLN